MFVGSGPVAHKQGDADMEVDPSLVFDLGVGTTPDARFVFGGLFRLQTIFGSGSDLALLARGATRGFQAGDFGIALDAGGYARFWGTESAGFVGGATLGAPLGLTLALTAHVGTDSSLGFGAVAGLDFARLTAFRQTLLDWWPNPLPVQREPYGDAAGPPTAPPDAHGRLAW